MADTQNINAVTALQSIDANDSILVSDGNTSLAKIDYNKLAKSIIEQYTGSTLAGSGQSIQSAFNALNSKMPTKTTPPSVVTSFEDLASNESCRNIYYRYNGLNWSDAPSGIGDYWATICATGPTGNANGIIVHIWENSRDRHYTRVYNANQWRTDWIVQSTRDEVDTLNSKLMPNADFINSTTALNDVTASGFYNYGANTTDAPTANSGTLMVMANNYGLYLTQFATPANESIVYYRYRNNTTWTTWKALPSRDEVDLLNSKANLYCFRAGTGDGSTSITVPMRNTGKITIFIIGTENNDTHFSVVTRSANVIGGFKINKNGFSVISPRISESDNTKVIIDVPAWSEFYCFGYYPF